MCTYLCIHTNSGSAVVIEHALRYVNSTRMSLFTLKQLLLQRLYTISLSIIRFYQMQVGTLSTNLQ